MTRIKRWPQTEEQLAAAVVQWLRSEQWEVYQEVQICFGGAIADIVAVREPVVWVIETKRTLSLDAIQQAEDWHGHAHLASVAVPKPQSRRLAGQRVCRLVGVGLLYVIAPTDWCGSHCTEEQRSRFHRKAKAYRLRSALSDRHKDFAPAGNSRGRRWSPWRETCDRLARVVADSPGIILKDAVASIQTHYYSDASARSSLSRWMREGKIEGVLCERDGRFLRLYPDAEVEA